MDENFSAWVLGAPNVKSPANTPFDSLHAVDE
jgi:hypothetical protein